MQVPGRVYLLCAARRSANIAGRLFALRISADPGAQLNIASVLYGSKL